MSSSVGRKTFAGLESFLELKLEYSVTVISVDAAFAETVK